MIVEIVYELRWGCVFCRWYLYRTKAGTPWEIIAVFDDEDDAKFAQQMFQQHREQYKPPEQPQ